MSKILIPAGGGGGVHSEDVTASRSQVMMGYRTITTDSDDEVIDGTATADATALPRDLLDGQSAYVKGKKIQGAMPNHGGTTDVAGLRNEGFDLFAAINPGAYINKAPSGAPEIKIPHTALRPAIGYTNPEKVLSDTVICGLRGAMNNQGSQRLSVDVNGTMQILQGYHDGTGFAFNHTETMGAQYITPSKQSIVLHCTGKYMTGDVTIAPVEYGRYVEGHATFAESLSGVPEKYFYVNPQTDVPAYKWWIRPENWGWKEFTCITVFNEYFMVTGSPTQGGFNVLYCTLDPKLKSGYFAGDSTYYIRANDAGVPICNTRASKEYWFKISGKAW